jgi:hypothetical protein
VWRDDRLEVLQARGGIKLIEQELGEGRPAAASLLLVIEAQVPALNTW